jgi:hypothetical protein
MTGRFGEERYCYVVQLYVITEGSSGGSGTNFGAAAITSIMVPYDRAIVCDPGHGSVPR